MVVTGVYQPEVSQFDFCVCSVFNSSFTKFVLGSSGGIKFVILVEDSETGDPRLITVRMKYLFALQFSCCELSVGNK